ncbi:MAG TPA: glycosyltransferase family 4 protein [Opitutaceae bacterium]
MTADTLGGVWTYALELCHGLAAHDIEVVLATMGAPARADQRREAAALGNVLLCESAFALEWMDAPWDDVRAAGDWLLDLEQRFAPDVIHLNGYAHGALPWTAPVLAVGHSCVLSWWRAVKGSDAPAAWRTYADTVRNGLQAVQQVVAPTRWMADALSDHYGPLPPVRVIPNARTPAPFPPPREKEPFVLGVGRLWDEAKNTHVLARLAPGLPWPVRLIGETCRPGGAERPPGGLELLGYLPARDVACQCHRAALYVAPARYEPFGLSILEAATAGCALVLGDIPSLRESWDGAAVFVPPDDATGLRASLSDLIAAPSLRERLGACARERAQRFTVKRMTRGYLETYEELRGREFARSNPALAAARSA